MIVKSYDKWIRFYRGGQEVGVFADLTRTYIITKGVHA